MFLLAQLLFHHAALGWALPSRALGIGALAILAVAVAQLTMIVGIAASSAVLIAVAITDRVHQGRSGAEPVGLAVRGEPVRSPSPSA